MLTRLPRLRTLAVMACVAGAVPVVASSTVATAAPTASAARTCTTSIKYPGVGYFTSLKTTRLSCRSGRSNMKAHYNCRTKHSKSGKCSSVRGYKCTETRKSIPTEYDARVTCSKKKHGKTYKFIYTYQQER